MPLPAATQSIAESSSAEVARLAAVAAAAPRARHLDEPAPRPDLRSFFRSLYIWVGVAVITTSYFPVVAIWSCAAWLLGDKTWSLGHKMARFWARTIFKLNPAWTLAIDDTRIPPGRHFVVASSHASSGDIIVNLQLVHHFKFISKDTNFRVPFMGWFMYFAGYIPLRRGSKKSVARCFERSRWYLSRGVSVLFYPEGTRSRDGALLPFKPGAFQLAIEAGVDVLPVAVVGTARLLPRASFFFSRIRTPFRIIAGDPIPVAGLTHQDVPALAARTRAAITAIKERAEAEALASLPALRS